MDSLSQKIKLLRGNRSQEDFAKILGLSQPDIQRYESGKVKPKANFFESVRKNLGVNLDWFFDEKTDMYVQEPTTNYGVKFKTAPVVGYADCGLTAPQWEKVKSDDIVVTGVKSIFKNIIAFKAKGDSMSPYIIENDLLVCGEAEFRYIKDKSAVVVVFKSGPDMSEQNAKLFIRDKEDDSVIYTYSINTKNPPQKIKLNRVHKIYKVIKIQRDVA